MTIRAATPAEASFFGSAYVYEDPATGVALVAAPDPTLPAPHVTPTPDEITTIIRNLPNTTSFLWRGILRSALSGKLAIILGLIRAAGASSWNSNPASDPLFGLLWATYEANEAEGDAIAAAWPVTASIVTVNGEPVTYNGLLVISNA